MGVAKAERQRRRQKCFLRCLFYVQKYNRTFVILIISCYNVDEKEVELMRKQKYYLAIDDYERSVIINSLNNLRNKLISDGRYTDAVDELIIKFAHASLKKFKIKMTGTRGTVLCVDKMLALWYRFLG